MSNTYILKIFRGSPGNQYWEEFEFPRMSGANVISSLMKIQENPINIKGEKVTPVVWEQGCLEEVCGSCSMLINGRPRQACTALIENLIQKTGSHVIKIAPFTKFPLVRDLIVDRSIMFENLKKVNAWIEVDGSYDRGPGEKISQEKQEIMYTLSTCMTCGCCSEACIGPAVMSQVQLFNDNPIGKMQKSKRLRPLLEKGGISDCNNAQNCVEVCPKKIPLTDSIATMNREVTVQALKDFFSLPDRN
jgi:succinate dehydrogenase / fumarate reductase iron-sulfur subunit